MNKGIWGTPRSSPSRTSAATEKASALDRDHSFLHNLYLVLLCGTGVLWIKLWEYCLKKSLEVHLPRPPNVSSFQVGDTNFCDMKFLPVCTDRLESLREFPPTHTTDCFIITSAMEISGTTSKSRVNKTLERWKFKMNPKETSKCLRYILSSKANHSSYKRIHPRSPTSNNLQGRLFTRNGASAIIHCSRPPWSFLRAEWHFFSLPCILRHASVSDIWQVFNATVKKEWINKATAGSTRFSWPWGDFCGRGQQLGFAKTNKRRTWQGTPAIPRSKLRNLLGGSLKYTNRSF